MDFKAYKMDGLGNDFVIIDQREKKYAIEILLVVISLF